MLVTFFFKLKSGSFQMVNDSTNAQIKTIDPYVHTISI